MSSARAAVVADTGPLNYLIQINAIELLPKLFGRIIVPALARRAWTSHAPVVVRDWIAQVPPWLEVRENPDRKNDVAIWPSLDEGERAAVALAAAIGLI